MNSNLYSYAHIITYVHPLRTEGSIEVCHALQTGKGLHRPGKIREWRKDLAKERIDLNGETPSSFSLFLEAYLIMSSNLWINRNKMNIGNVDNLTVSFLPFERWITKPFLGRSISNTSRPFHWIGSVSNCKYWFAVIIFRHLVWKIARWCWQRKTWKALDDKNKLMEKMICYLF